MSPRRGLADTGDDRSTNMPPLRGWTLDWSWLYKHVVPTGLALAVTVLFLLWPFAATADDLIVTNQTPAFALDTRLPSGEPPGGSLIVQAETPPFTLDTRLPDGVAPSSGTVVTESGTFTLDTRLPDGVTPSSGTVVTESPPFTLDTRLPDGISFTNGVVIAESPPFTLDTRLPTDTTPPASLVVTAESPPFTLDTRLPSDTTPLPNLVTQAESPAFTLDTRIPPLDVWWITRAESAPFTLDTLSGSFTTPAQTLTGGTTGGKARFSPDGLRLAKTDGNQVLLWNLHSIRTNFTFTGHAAEVATLDFSPLGDQLLTGSADGTLRWWDTASRAELGRTSPSGAGTVYAAYASDGARILAGRGVNAALYRVPALQLLQEFTGSAGSISAVAVCPEGLALAGNSDRFAVIWDTATGQILCRLTNHTKLITAAAFFPGGTNAMTASLDGTIRIWNTATGAEMLRIQAGAQVGDAALSLDGRVIASCDTATPGTAYLWDAQNGGMLRVFTDTGSEASQIKGVAISPDQTALATTHADGRVRLWDTGLDPRPIYPVTPLGIGTNSPVTLRSHGLYYFAINADAGRSVVVTLEADPGSGSKLKMSAGIPVGSALSSDAEFANLGAPAADKNAGTPRTKSLQTPPPGADITAFRMTATRVKLPSQYDYETFAQASVTNLHCEIPLAITYTSKVYVLVYAPYLAAGSIAARIEARYTDFHLSSVSHTRGGNAGSVTVRVRGTGFGSNTVATLSGVGGAIITGVPVYPPDTTEMTIRFDLRSAVAGTYDFIVRNEENAATIPNGFEIVDGGQSEPKIEWGGPSAVRFGRSSTFTATVENPGLTDLQNVAVLFSIVPANPAGQLPAEGLPTYSLYQSYLASGDQTSSTLRIAGNLLAQCYRVERNLIKLEPETIDNCDTLELKMKFVLRNIENAKDWIAALEEGLPRRTAECQALPLQQERDRCMAGLRSTYEMETIRWKDELFELERIKAALCAAMSREDGCKIPPECAAGSAAFPNSVVISTPTGSSCESCGDTKLQLGNSIVLVGANWAVISAGTASQSKDASSVDFCVVRPIDPNDKIGPVGIGPNRVVSTNDFMEYMVRFENMAAATAPVQELTVVDYLDANLDWTTVEFEEVAYGDRLLAAPAHSQYFTLRDLPPTNSTTITGSSLTNLAVNISAMFNSQAGRLECRMSVVDTNTGIWPLDALTGFLPPENGSGRGQGHVRFRVKPKAATPFGTAITNVATIVFDGNDPIDTPAVWNIVGDVPSLAVTIAYLPGQIMAGMPFTYTVGLTNTGTNAIMSVILTNALPSGMTVLNTTATLGTVTVTNGTLVWDLGTLAGGAGATLTITASATQSGTFANNFYYSGGSGLAIYTVPSDLIVLEPPPPQLTIRLLSGNVELSWPTNASAFHLQSAVSIAPAAWGDLTNTPATLGGFYRVTVGAPVSSKYFRLVKP